MDHQAALRDKTVSPPTEGSVHPSEHSRDPAPRTRRRRRTAKAGACHEARDPEADERTTRQSVRNGMVAMLVAATVLLLFNSAGLRMWARDLPGNAVTDQMVLITGEWHRLMKQVGIAAPKAFMQDAIAELRDQSWRETVALPTTETDESKVN